MGLAMGESAQSVFGSKAYKAEEGYKGSRGLNEPFCPIPPNPPAGFSQTKGLFSCNPTCRFYTKQA